MVVEAEDVERSIPLLGDPLHTYHDVVSENGKKEHQLIEGGRRSSDVWPTNRDAAGWRHRWI